MNAIQKLEQKIENLQTLLSTLVEKVTFTPKRNLTLFEWLDEWLEVYKKPAVSAQTFRYNSIVIRLHIKENIQNKNLIDITPADINVCLSRIKSTRTRETAFQILCQVFRSAYQNNLIEKNISNGFIKPKHKRAQGYALTSQQIKIFLENTKKIKYGNIFDFYLYSGARRQGALNLEWKHIKGNYIFLNETKSKNAPRYIPKFKNLENLLKNTPKIGEKVFNISDATLKREHIKLKKLCGFNFKIKDLRHTFATLCSQNNINERMLASWLGHSSPNVTKKYYIHKQTEFEKQEIQKINKILEKINL